MTPVRLDPAAPRSQVKHSTSEPLRSLKKSPYFPEAGVVISEYFLLCLLIFKACRLGHPDFEIKFIDFFASNVIKTQFITQECI